MTDGGPAFPNKITLDRPVGMTGLGEYSLVGGMSLRDWFAGQAPVDFAMALSVFGTPQPQWGDATIAAFFAVWAMMRYEYADAMLKARGREGA